jgi:hypothetical protein
VNTKKHLVASGLAMYKWNVLMKVFTNFGDHRENSLFSEWLRAKSGREPVVPLKRRLCVS